MLKRWNLCTYEFVAVDLARVASIDALLFCDRSIPVGCFIFKKKKKSVKIVDFEW